MTTVGETLKKIKSSQDSLKTLSDLAYYGLSEADREYYQSQDFVVYQGKVRELVRRGDRLLIFHTDRLTAFDRLIGMVPYKGLILSEISKYWLEAVSKIVPTHFIRAINERVLEVKACQPIKAEVIVRGYMAGSMMRAYEKGVRSFCGQTLPEGLQPYRSLPKPIVTPTSKAAVFEHDEDATPEELVQQGVCTKEEWRKIEELALKLFAVGQRIYGEKGWILVDTKYEMGRTPEGDIIVIDEIHTPDSSRLWVKANYETRLQAGEVPEMLDKENVRRYLMEHGFSGYGDVPEVPAEVLVSLAEVYLKVAETLIGKPLEIRTEDFRVP